MSYIKQNSSALATTCKSSHVDEMNGAHVGPIRVRIDMNKNPVQHLGMVPVLQWPIVE